MMKFIPIITKKNSDQGICCVPIADLIERAACDSVWLPMERGVYQTLALGDTDCLRTYQLLLHEYVDIVAYRHDEVCIRVPHIFYYNEKTKKHDNLYWTLAANVAPVRSLSAETYQFLPPYSRYAIKSDESVVVLTTPYVDEQGKRFSVGTKFKIDEQASTEQYVICFFLNKDRIETMRIPRHYVTTCVYPTYEEKIAHYISFLRALAHRETKFIAYVYGGSSFVEEYSEHTFVCDAQTNCYDRSEHKHVYPRAGFDCSCLISRGLQMCGFSYFYKDSATIKHHLQSIKHPKELTQGDIIWFPGHVVVVSDRVHNLVIEARGYGSGFGKVHEIPLDALFKDIHTFDDLEAAFFTKQPLHLLDAHGAVRYDLPDYSLLSLRSGLAKRVLYIEV